MDTDDDDGRTPLRLLLANLIAAGVGVVWLLLLPAVFVVGLLFVGAVRSANGAPQEAAAGAVYSTVLIGLYVALRCVEKAGAALEKFLRG